MQVSSSEVQALLQKTKALSRHESAHYIITFVCGFQSSGLSLVVEPEAHRGKAYGNAASRCESLEELQCFVLNRITIKLAGAMGEALDPNTLKVDAASAYHILESGITGAAQDFAVANELVNLLHNTKPLEINPATTQHFTSRELLLDVMSETYLLVSRNANSICQLAMALEEKVIFGKGNGTLNAEEIGMLGLYNLITL